MNKPIIVYAVEVENGYLPGKWGSARRTPRLWQKPSFPKAVAEEYNKRNQNEARVVTYRLLEVPCSVLPKDEELRKAAIDDMEAQKLITKKEAEELRK